MNTPSSSFPPSSPPEKSTSRSSLLSSRPAQALAILGFSLACGLVAIKAPVLSVCLAAAGLAAVLMLQRAEIAVFVALFVLWSNVAVVSVHFHGVPRFVAAVFPLLLAVPVLYNTIVRGRSLTTDRTFLWLLAFVVVQAIGTIFARESDTALEGLIEVLTEGILLYFLIFNAIRSKASLRIATWGLVCAGVIMGGVPLIQQLTGTFHDNYGGLAQMTDVGFQTGKVTARGAVRQFQLAGPIGEQNRFAQIMLMLIPIGLFCAQSESRRWLKLAAYAATALAGIGFVLAFSRGGAVAFVLLVLIMVILGTITRRQILLLLLAACLVLVIMPHYAARILTIRNLTSNLTDGDGPKDSSFAGRTTEMIAAMLAFRDHPLVGVGPRMGPHYIERYGNRLGIHRLDGERQAHSLYLGLAAETGALGLACFLAMVAIPVTGLWRKRRELLLIDPELAALATGLMLSLIAYLASGMFLHQAYIRYFYVILALAGVAYRLTQETIEAATVAELKVGEGERDR